MRGRLRTSRPIYGREIGGCKSWKRTFDSPPKTFHARGAIPRSSGPPYRNSRLPTSPSRLKSTLCKPNLPPFKPPPTPTPLPPQSTASNGKTPNERSNSWSKICWTRRCPGDGCITWSRSSKGTSGCSVEYGHRCLQN